MSGADLSRMESYQYPATHIGHLNPQQESALQAFKQLCEEKGYYTLQGAKGKPSHDDETMLRYLRARKFNPAEAFKQFKDTEDWRKENQLDKLYDTIDINEYEQTRVLYPQWTGRRDRRGIPVYLYEVAHLNSKAITAYETSTSSKNTSKVPVKMLRLFALYENLINFALPLCSELPDRPYPETPVSQSSNIVDISNVGLRQFWNLKAHMQDASTLATAHYPETLDRIFIIGAPSFFPTVWSWIKKWFDPITVSKIFILSKQTQYETLSQYIDPENIPEQYGGKLKYKFGELPNMDPAINEVLSWSASNKFNGKDTIPTGPVRWQTLEDGNMGAIAVGSENGKQRDRVVATLRAKKAAEKATLAPKPQEEESALYRTTSGVNTHPPTPPANEVVPEPSQQDLSEQSPQQELAFGGAPAVLPIRDAHKTESTQTSAFQSESVRDGTSHTRFSSQTGTHADGTLAEGTPQMHDAGAGDKYGVMEPNTVGQAPKEHPMPEPEPEPVSYVDQAKNAAGSAYSTAAGVGASALAAVGLGGAGNKQEETEHVEEPKKPEDPRVDQAADINVEEYLRNQTQSKAEAKSTN